MKIPISVAENVGVIRRKEPVEIGLPLPRGKAGPDAHWVILDEKENILPAQFKKLEISSAALQSITRADGRNIFSRTATENDRLRLGSDS